MEKFPLVKCPFCFKELTYNNAVFRCTTGEKAVDKYLKEYQAIDCGNTAFEREDFRFIDPAFLRKNQIETDKDGCIVNVEDPDPSATYALEQRLCPYCHNKLIRSFGKKPAKYIAVVGVTNCGKTTFLSAINSVLKMKKWSWESLDYAQNKPLEDVTDMYVDGFTSAKVATKEIQGPYYYGLNVPTGVDNKKHNKYDNHIVFLDVPGEFFSRADKITNVLKNYLSVADGIIFIINTAETIQNALGVTALDIIEAFRQQGIIDDKASHKKVAIVFNKIDLVKDQLGIDEMYKFLPKETVDTVDSSHIDQRSDTISAFMLADGKQVQNPIQRNLNVYMNRIQQAFGDSCRLFATSLIIEDEENGGFRFRPQGAETPFLWLLSEMDAFPKKQ